MVGQKVCASKQSETQQTRLNRQTKECKIADFSVPLDQNVSMKETEKVNNYMPLISELQQLYRGYKCEIIPVVVGALGAVPKSLKRLLENIGLSGNMKENAACSPYRNNQDCKNCFVNEEIEKIDETLFFSLNNRDRPTLP